MDFKNIKLKSGARVYLDMDIRPTRCRTCGAKIQWAVSSGSKNVPIERDPDGTYQFHFAACERAVRFQQGRLADKLAAEELTQSQINNL